MDVDRDDCLNRGLIRSATGIESRSRRPQRRLHYRGGGRGRRLRHLLRDRRQSDHDGGGGNQ